MNEWMVVAGEWLVVSQTYSTFPYFSLSGSFRIFIGDESGTEPDGHMIYDISSISYIFDLYTLQSTSRIFTMP